jgi:UDP-2,3-diacylglucosamine pyrophosphatase LpxH
VIGTSQTGFVIDSSEGPIFLISDIHAGALEPTVDAYSKQMLDDLLQLVGKVNGRLIILGDLFDYWQESGHRTPKQLQSWLGIFSRYRQQSKQTVLITGNHDHWADTALSNIGFVLVHDHVMVTTKEGPWLLLHGDGLPTDELKLIRKGLNKQFRNPIYNAIFGILPLGIRVGIMRAFSYHRKQRGHDYKENQHIDNYLMDWLLNHDFLGVVYGHTHEKVLRNLDGKYLANTGTFYTDGTVMVIDGTTPIMTTVDELKSIDSAKMTYIMPDGTRR